MSRKKEKRGNNKKLIGRLLLISAEVFLLFLMVGLCILGVQSKKQEQDEETAKQETGLPKPVPQTENDRNVTKETEMETEEETAETEENQETVLAFAGDVLFAEGYANVGMLSQRGGDIASCFGASLFQQMQDADIFMINNEFPYTLRGTPTEEKQFTFRANPERVNLLTDMGVDLVTIANNHVYDYGEISLLDTLDTLDAAGIPHGGAGKNRKEAQRPVTLTVNNRKISFICATQVEQLDVPDTVGATDSRAGVFRCWNNEDIYDVIREAAEESDFVICYIHWGEESSEELHWAQTDQAKKMVDAGADLIVGAHPHIWQKVEYINGVPVIYSLGNFWFNSKTMDTGLLKVVLQDDGIDSIQLLPAIQSGCRTDLAEQGEKERILSHLRELSPDVHIDAEGFITP